METTGRIGGSDSYQGQEQDQRQDAAISAGGSAGRERVVIASGSPSGNTPCQPIPDPAGG